MATEARRTASRTSGDGATGSISEFEHGTSNFGGSFTPTTLAPPARASSPTPGSHQVVTSPGTPVARSRGMVESQIVEPVSAGTHVPDTAWETM
jgi:hypothetical protein